MKIRTEKIAFAVFVFLLVFSFAVMFVACGNKDAKDTSEEKQSWEIEAVVPAGTDDATTEEKSPEETSALPEDQDSTQEERHDLIVEDDGELVIEVADDEETFGE